MKYFFAIIFAALLVGCNSPTHYQVKAGRHLSIPRESRVYVGVTTGSSKEVSDQVPATALTHAAQKYFKSTEAGSEAKDMEANTKAALVAKCDFLLLPRVIFWEDNAPAWSGNPDRLEVQFTAVNLANDETSVSSVLITGPWWTMMSYSPGEFMDTACDNYVRYTIGELKKDKGRTKF